LSGVRDVTQTVVEAKEKVVDSLTGVDDLLTVSDGLFAHELVTKETVDDLLRYVVASSHWG
jgi:heme-degrading monooxygenase HmoA